MLERLKYLREQYDATMFSYGNARVRVYMGNNRIEAGFDLSPKELDKYIDAAETAREWHDIVGKTQLAIGLASLTAGKFIRNKFIRTSAIVNSVLLLLAAMRSYNDKHFMETLSKAASQDKLRFSERI